MKERCVICGLEAKYWRRGIKDTIQPACKGHGEFVFDGENFVPIKDIKD